MTTLKERANPPEMPPRAHFTILHTEWSDGWGGQERRILSEMTGMAERGHRLILATRSQAALAGRARASGIETVELPFSGKFDLRSILPLARLIRREGIDIVNTHSGIDSWVGAFAARLGGAHLVRTRHLNLPLRRHWYNFVHFMARRIVSCGETMRHNLIDDCGFPAEQVVSIPTGIDFDAFAARRPRAEIRRALALDDTAFVILMVGIIRAVKRHEVALRAFAKFRESTPRAVLLLAGDGPMRGDMERLAQNLGIAESVHFLGHREDVPDLFAAADCALLTSRSEGVPQAVTQGLGCGLPTIATRVGGVPELIEDGKTGLLAESEDVDAIAAGLERLAADPDFARQLGEAGRTHVHRHFSRAAMLDATERLYAELCCPCDVTGQHRGSHES